jgi:hypothetical protein
MSIRFSVEDCKYYSDYEHILITNLLLTDLILRLYSEKVKWSIPKKIKLIP